MEPIDRRSVSQSVLARLLDLLKSGKIKPGEQLPTEQQIMQELGVSRPPVREALNALAGMGVIEKRHGSGHYLRAVRFDQLLASEAAAFLDLRGQVVDMVEARLLLEVEIFAKVTREARLEAAARLGAWLTRTKALLDAGQYTPEQSAEFHITLAELTGNSVLSELVAFMIRMSLQTEAAGLAATFNAAEDFRLHAHLLDVILIGDEEDARTAMRRHLDAALDRARLLEGYPITAQGAHDV